MLDSDTVANQQALLATYRLTLSFSLEQAAAHGGERFAPPQVRHSIDQARAEIKRIKGSLREYGIAVADEPNDVAAPISPWRGMLRIPLLIVVLVITLFIATSLLSALTNIGPVRQQLQLWGVWPLPFAPGQSDETLIVIVPFFRTEGVVDHFIANNIAERVRGDVDKITLPNMRVEVLEGQQLRANDRAGAEALGKHANASIIIWGADTGVKVEVKYLNLRQPDFDAAEISLQEQGAEGRTEVANAQPYAEFVTDDLPQVMSFLSLFAVGQATYIQQDYKQAAQIIEQALMDVQRAPQDTVGQADANFRLGWLRNELGEQQQALKAYDQAIALNPQYAQAYNNRGVLRSEQGDPAGARTDCDQAIALNPQFAQAYNNRGVLRREQGEIAGARADYDQAIALNPQFALAYYNRGVLHYNQGNKADARTDFLKTRDLATNDATRQAAEAALQALESE